MGRSSDSRGKRCRQARGVGSIRVGHVIKTFGYLEKENINLSKYKNFDKKFWSLSFGFISLWLGLQVRIF